MRKIRCAIYTRKSSEEGLDQEFNSLDAQREACAAYIASQKHEGWVMLPDHYDDGGISGGTLERAALKRLMRDVDDGSVDQIVVYKIDRLTRSLSDFAKLVDRLDAKQASFVSVTQSFNTATSMGRLTLNVLLSFAQFEREVTAERIRDKIAASKKKGLWMGGNVPLGYDPDGRTLTINEEEAKTVTTLFDLYEADQTIRAVKEQADRLKLKGKQKQLSEAINPKAASLSRGQIYNILSNPIYAGKIRHKDQIYDGQHDAIIPAERWESVQLKLKQKAGRKRGRANTPESKSPLIGKLVDETGDRLTPSHANKQGRRYRYYVSNRLISKRETEDQAGSHHNDNRAKVGWRLPAAALEQQLADAVCKHLGTQLMSGNLQVNGAEEVARLDADLAALRLSTISSDQVRVLKCIRKVSLEPGKVIVDLNQKQTAKLLDIDPSALSNATKRFPIQFQSRKRGVETRLIIGASAPDVMDDVLIRNIGKAHAYYNAVKSGLTFDQIASNGGMSKRRLLQIIPLAFLAPDITKSIVSGTQSVELTTEWLQRHPLPADWQEQRTILANL